MWLQSIRGYSPPPATCPDASCISWLCGGPQATLPLQAALVSPRLECCIPFWVPHLQKLRWGQKDGEEGAGSEPRKSYKGWGKSLVCVAWEEGTKGSSSGRTITQEEERTCATEACLPAECNKVLSGVGTRSKLHSRCQQRSGAIPDQEHKASQDFFSLLTLLAFEHVQRPFL